jgi:hypothetical protein
MLGVKLEGVILTDVQMTANYPDTALIDFPYMREGDFVKKLCISNVMTDGVEHLARVHKRADECDINLGHVFLAPTTVKRVAPPEVKRSELTFKPFAPDIERSYERK